MKNLSLILNALLIVAVAVLFYLYSTLSPAGISEEDKAQKAAIDSISQNITIAYVNTDSIWANYEYVKDAKSDLQSQTEKLEARINTKINELESELKERADKLDEEVRQFQKDAAGMSQAIQQIKMQKLQEKDYELQEFQLKAQEQIMTLRDELAQQLMEEETVKNQEIRTNIEKHIREYNDKHRYTYILAKSTGNAVIEAHESLDITNDVLETLNAEYAEQKAEAAE